MDMRDLFSVHRSSKKLNESLQKVFGKKINFENFSLDQLQDARNKLRTQISQVKESGNFNETVENEAYQEARFMLDAINAEIDQREEFIIDSATEEEYNSTQGDDMRRVTEGEIQQAQSIVSAKTMVDRVGRWIEELSGMENDSLLQLGDQIRDEMGQEQSKAFIESVAPAIQQALENLKATRETLASGVRILTGEEQPVEMLGGDQDDTDMDAAEPDAMNQTPEEPLDDFEASEPGVGAEEAGRAQRESINFQNRLMKVLAG